MAPREQKKEATRQALASTAIALFSERGYDEVTVAEIAERAGVSRRTAFRYFASKDELVMEHPDQWMRVFDASLASNRDLRLSERLRVAADAVTSHIESNPEPVRQLFELAFTHPTISASYARNSQQWVERVMAEVFIDANVDDTTGGRMLEAAVLASAYMGVVNSVCLLWARTGGSMAELVNDGFAALDAGITAFD